MKFNIASLIIFTCTFFTFFIGKNYYLAQLYFDGSSIELVEKIKNINDIKHLQSVAEGLTVDNQHTSDSYNGLLNNSVEALMWLSFMGAFFAFGSILESKNNAKHSNKQLQPTTNGGG